MILHCLTAAAFLGGFVPTVKALNETDAANVLFIKQEEKLARDVYLALHDIWGHTTFANISVSEQRHMDAMDGLIARYKLEDSTPTELGKFTYEDLTNLYAALMELGTQSIEDALYVGVLIEETDIEDLTAAIAVTREKPIKQVLTNLCAGSYNHLEAFLSALSRL